MPRGIVQFQTDGRSHPAVQNTIGYFATPLFLRAELGSRSFADLQALLHQEYCRAQEIADAGRIDVIASQPGSRKSPLFNWVPECGFDSAEASQASVADTRLFSMRPVSFRHPILDTYELDHEPAIVLHDRAREVAGTLLFPRCRLAESTMRRFVENYQFYLQEMQHRPDRRISDLSLL